LRDEFVMADEAFALSPISARATGPREEDYHAISEAFMETSRGRWFLGEYARRNRNADTRMVLDAVARIEESLAAQKRSAPEAGLADTLTVIRTAVEQARAAAAAAIDSLALEENLTPIRKGARVIREIAWRLREIGADGRICDLIESQLGAIEAGSEQISSADPMVAVSAAFDLVEQRIAALGDGDTAVVPAVAEAIRPPSPAPTAPSHSEAAIDPSARAEAAAATAKADVTTDAAHADDEAVLDLIAFEMAADPAEAETSAGPGEIHLAEPQPMNVEIGAAQSPVPQMPEPVAAPARPPMIQPVAEPSLGSTLIASGIVRKPDRPGSDPLAPIRRMSQAEKIALFS
jgi:hypothetical protein